MAPIPTSSIAWLVHPFMERRPTPTHHEPTMGWFTLVASRHRHVGGGSSSPDHLIGSITVLLSQLRFMMSMLFDRVCQVASHKVAAKGGVSGRFIVLSL